MDYILNKVNYQTLMMLLADAPRYVKKKICDDYPNGNDREEDEVLGFFQSKLGGKG